MQHEITSRYNDPVARSHRSRSKLSSYNDFSVDMENNVFTKTFDEGVVFDNLYVISNIVQQGTSNLRALLFS